jgi:hypothetical protein
MIEDRTFRTKGKGRDEEVVVSARCGLLHVSLERTFQLSAEESAQSVLAKGCECKVEFDG